MKFFKKSIVTLFVLVISFSLVSSWAGCSKDNSAIQKKQTTGHSTTDGKNQSKNSSQSSAVDKNNMVPIVWDAMTAVNGAANMSMLFMQDNMRWPRNMGEILTYAKMANFPYHGKSDNGWWVAEFDTSMVISATSTLSMPHGAGKRFIYDMKTRQYFGYGLEFMSTGSRNSNALRDTTIITKAFAYGDSILALRAQNLSNQDQ